MTCTIATSGGELILKCKNESELPYIINTQYIEECYNKADQYMIEKSDLLFIFGKYSSNLYSIDYAKKIGIDIRLYSDLFKGTLRQHRTKIVRCCLNHCFLKQVVAMYGGISQVKRILDFVNYT